jgi:hypothetical protein
MAGILMQRVDHVLLVFIDQGAIAEGGIHSVFSLSGWAVRMSRGGGVIKTVL